MPKWVDSFTDTTESDERQYLACGACGHGTLPPRRLCPACGQTDLTREPLSKRGTVLPYTELSVTIPEVHGETPHTVALVELDEEVTLRDGTADDTAIGDEVGLGTEPRDAGTAVLTFRPAEE